LVAAWLAMPALDADAAQDALEPVVVTGSRLAGGAAESGLPVQVISRRDIERSGAVTTADLLQRVAANQPYNTEAMSVGGYGPAAYAGANLRGLGDNNTLVLVNGRRIAQHAATFGTSADLLSIPLAAVERVEILKDGASALYGADAIGGVINFILRNDYSGVDLQLDLAGTSHGGAGRQGLSLTAGGALGDSEVHWVGSVSFLSEQRLASSQRDFTRSSNHPGLVNGLSYGSWPATVSDAAGNLYSPAGCRPPYSVIDPDGTGLCVYDPATSVDLQPSSHRVNALLRAEGPAWDASARWYAEIMASRATQRVTATPAWVSGFDPATGAYAYPVLGSGSPFYPTAWADANGVSGDLDLFYWRMADQGPRVDRHVGDQQRWLAGLQGVAGAWQWDGALVATRHRLVSSMAQGYYRYADIAALVADGSINPLGEQSAATQARLDALAVRDPYAWMETRTESVDLKLSRTLWRLPGGDAGLALGGELRRETLGSRYSQDALDCVISGGLCGGFNLDRGRSVAAAFGELSLPFAPAWSAQLALRHDRYGIGGTATTPKLALTWRMTPAVRWRASAGRGFIAPSLEQLYAPATLGVAPGSGQQDTTLCGVTGSAYDCGLLGYNQRTSGNAQLQPETSRQFGFGLVLGATPRWQINADLWAVNKRNKIGYVPAGTVFANQALYESLGYVVRYQPGDVLPAGTACVDGVCPIQFVDAQYRNLGQQKTAGLDLGATWRSTATGWGVWSAMLDATWVQRFATQVSSVSAFIDQAGRYALDRPVPRWRHQARMGLEQGAWSWSLSQRFVASYIDYNPEPASLPDRRARAQSLWDVSAAYRLGDAVTVALTVQNLANSAPPPSRQVNAFQVGYDPHFADPRGRIVALRTQVKF
jgi:iron complex outermembrane receptor protein